MASDFSSQFRQSCQRHSYYPNNLLQVTQEAYTRNGIFQKPRVGVEGKQGFFAKEAASTKISRAGIGVLPVVWTSLDELKHGLNEAQREPTVQYVFIRADHAKRLLCCSIEMFTYLMSFYQVPPAMLDLMSIFKHSEVSLDRHFTGFVGEYTYSPDRRDSIIPISQLGRSGCYLKQCYQLRFLEKVHYQPLSWRAHQVVVHHSFDILNGQALWITLEGNVSLDERIRAMLSQCSSARNYTQAFELTLSTHLMLCQWCIENWQEFIEGIEIELCQFKATVQSVEPGSTPASRDRSHGTYSTATSSPGPPIQSFANATRIDRDQFPALLQTHDSDLDSSISLDHLDPRDTYDIADIQKLYKAKDRLTEALLMAKLNSSVLSQLGGYYAGLHLKVASRFAGNKSDLEDFTEKMGAFKNRMEVCQAQLEDLLSIQRDIKAQMDDIADFRSLQMNKFFAMESRKSADRMEKLTLEATREASSMHIITIVTLIFLPATFTARRRHTSSVNAVAFLLDSMLVALSLVAERSRRGTQPTA
ncbi:uncharacterized protein BDR25DRAFT_345294 [Lindgomyces ingoldianus]|uniref:Uncharacterized protein n=1 Tax=Lindgomyces ingoldianus TaxID=673940 RepID=A0ACB6QIA6_9PLEO|nr:uncharacterized protein BDR25DRAFT_345294 [Lindgomyces ingoldianus]KAF2466683.1 hypothetical protein BDR25DRAFT_345294 [Lindgomyces ingoldianus]